MVTFDRSTEFKTGRRPIQVATRVFNKDDVLFEENTTGRELYIVKEGRVGVYKGTPDGVVELAVIAQNGIVGEMSLLDNQPRSATVRALEKTKVTVINDKVFNAALETVPGWLTSIVRIIVSRLRDTNKRVDQSALREKERGLVSLLILLMKENMHERAAATVLEYDMILVEAYFISGLNKKETEMLLKRLEQRNILEMVQDPKGKREVRFKDVEVLTLFHEYCALKSQKKKFREIAISADGCAVLDAITGMAGVSAVASEGDMMLPRSTVSVGLKGKSDQYLESVLIDLRRKGIISVVMKDGEHYIAYKPENIARIKKIQQWLPQFEMELQ